MQLTVAIGSAIESVVQFLLSAIFMWSVHKLAQTSQKDSNSCRKKVGIGLEFTWRVGLAHSYRSQSDSDWIPRTVKQVHPFLSEYGQTPRTSIELL